MPSMPVSTRWLPLSTTHAQPPVPEAPGFAKAVKDEAIGAKIDEYDVNPRFENALLAGTDRWCAFPVSSYTPRARGCWVTVHKAGTEVEGSESRGRQEAGRFWPQDAQPWSVGAWMVCTLSLSEGCKC